MRKSLVGGSDGYNYAMMEIRAIPETGKTIRRQSPRIYVPPSDIRRAGQAMNVECAIVDCGFRRYEIKDTKTDRILAASNLSSAQFPRQIYPLPTPLPSDLRVASFINVSGCSFRTKGCLRLTWETQLEVSVSA